MESDRPNIFMVLITFALSCVFSGWILQVMWSWFVIPLGILPLSLAHAVGLNSLLTVYTYRDSGKQKNEKEFWESVLKSVIAHLILLLVGFIAHLAM